MRNKIFWGFGALILFLTLTNPSEREFENYIGSDGGKREWNFIVFSIYKHSGGEHYAPNPLGTTSSMSWRPSFNRTYLGISKNFFSIDS